MPGPDRGREPVRDNAWPHRVTSVLVQAAALLLVAALLARTSTPASCQTVFQPAFTSYGKAEGMPDPIVEALLQDATGFVWIGTHDGLLRFDGRTFRAFRARLEDPNSLVDDFISALAPADSGRIWVGSQRGGLQRFDPLLEEVLHAPLGELGPWRFDNSGGSGEDRWGRTVSGILPLPSGSLLLATDVGLVTFDPRSGAASTLLPSRSDEGPVRHATAICLTPRGVPVVALSDGSLARLEEDGSTVPGPRSLSDSVAAMTWAGDGLLAVTTYGTGWWVAPDLASAREVFRLPQSAARPRVVRDALVRDGRAWIATTIGVFEADLHTGSTRRVGEGEGSRSLPDQEASALLVDRAGLLWIGTWNGLASMHPLSDAMARLYAGSDMAGAGIVSIADAGERGLWLGSYGGGPQLLRRAAKGFDAPASRPPSMAGIVQGEIWDLAPAPPRSLWIAAFAEGIWLLEGEGPARPVPLLDIEGVARDATAYSVFVDHAGEVWSGTLPLGLLRYDPTRRAFRPHAPAGQPPPELGSDWVWPIVEDGQGRLWVGAVNGGVSMISADRTTATLHRAGPGALSDERILTLFVDSHDHVWVGTEGGGLNRLEPERGTWTTWTTDDGLPHDNVEGILEDDTGLLWVSTGDGLARFDPATGEFLVYREPAGLAGNRFFANAAYKDAGGMLYFGGEAGLTVVDPRALASEGTTPQVALTAFRIQGREAPLARAARTESLDLEPDENFFAFEFAAMDFADVSQNRYRYRLDPLDADWVEAGTTPVANYTSVPPGDYTFRVAARNSEGVWNLDALALPVRVQAPFHQTLWFRSLVAALVIGSALALYSYRMRQLHARQELRLEIAGKLHDDIGANLSTIALKAEMIRAGLPPDSGPTTQLADVGRLARETATKVRETVWVVNTRYDTLASLVSKMQDTADTLLAGAVPYTFNAPDSVGERRIAMEVRQNLHLLFKEALNNVAKHAKASRADITVRVEGPMLSLRVVDDGVGFDPAAAPEGNGRRLMEHRANALGATLRVTSAPGAGTTIDLTARLR